MAVVSPAPGVIHAAVQVVLLVRLTQLGSIRSAQVRAHDDRAWC